MRIFKYPVPNGMIEDITRGEQFHNALHKAQPLWEGCKYDVDGDWDIKTQSFKPKRFMFETRSLDGIDIIETEIKDWLPPSLLSLLTVLCLIEQEEWSYEEESDE